MLKKICTALALVPMVCTALYAQNYKLTWGDEMKLKKGTTDMDIVAADNSGVYFAESHLHLKAYFVVGATFGNEEKLVKFDKNFNEVFDKVYKKELKGYAFHSFQPLGNDLFLFATDYVKKEKTFKVYGVKIDKNTGDFIGELAELGSYNLESKKDDYDLKVDLINGGKNFLVVTDLSGKDHMTLAVSLLDNRLVKKENALINLTYAPGRYSLQDVKFTANKKIVLLGKEMEEVPTGRRKKTKVVFKQYALAIYDNKGKKEKDVVVDAGNRFIIGGKLIEQPDNDLLLAGFYSNTAKKDDLNGFYMNRLNVTTGELSLSSFKDISPAMLGQVVDDNAAADDDDDDKESKKEQKAKEAKDEEDEDEFPNNFIIRSADINQDDKSYVLTAEVSKYVRYTYMTTSNINGRLTSRWETVHQFHNDDILVISADKDGQIKWLNAVPKAQLEEVRSSSGDMGAGLSFYNDYSGFFANGGGMPYYSSYNTIINNNKLILVLNDHEDNKETADWGKKVKRISNFKKRSDTYGISIDLTTGKMIRKFISANSPDLILMPRHSYVVNNEVYIPSMRPRMMAKTEVKMAKLTVK